MNERKCKKCLNDKPILEFRDRSDRRTNICKECERKYQREWYWKNPERGRKKSNDSQKKARKDPEKRKALLKKQREHYHKKGKYTEKKYIADMRQNQPWLWRARNLKRNISKDITEEWLLKMYQAQNHLCALSGRKLDVMTFHIDHIKPKTLGGDDSLDNLRLVSPEANMAKNGLSDSELIELCKDILNTQIPELIGRAILEAEHGGMCE